MKFSKLTIDLSLVIRVSTFPARRVDFPFRVYRARGRLADRSFVQAIPSRYDEQRARAGRANRPENGSSPNCIDDEKETPRIYRVPCHENHSIFQWATPRKEIKNRPSIVSFTCFATRYRRTDKLGNENGLKKFILLVATFLRERARNVLLSVHSQEKKKESFRKTASSI